MFFSHSVVQKCDCNNKIERAISIVEFSVMNQWFRIDLFPKYLLTIIVDSSINSRIAMAFEHNTMREKLTEYTSDVWMILCEI